MDQENAVGGIGRPPATAARTYASDAENRLICVEPAPRTVQAGNLKVEFGCDYMGRRIHKKVRTCPDPNEPECRTVTGHRKHIWDGWWLLMDLDGMGQCGTSILPVGKHTGGLDLAGPWGGAGCKPRGHGRGRPWAARGRRGGKTGVCASSGTCWPRCRVGTRQSPATTAAGRCRS